MNPPSLRDICAKATPGPRYINDRGFTPVRVSSGTAFKSLGLFATFDAGDYAQTREQGFANAELCCRLPPATALAVYEALERSRAVIHKIAPTAAQSTLAELDRVLALLDGRTEL